MNWKTNRSAPKLGDRKDKNKFAFLPTELSSGWTVWLERYCITYEYQERSDGGYQWAIVETSRLIPNHVD